MISGRKYYKICKLIKLRDAPIMGIEFSCMSRKPQKDKHDNINTELQCFTAIMNAHNLPLDVLINQYKITMKN